MTQRATLRAAIKTVLDANTGTGKVLGVCYDAPNNPQKWDYGAYPAAEIHYIDKTKIGEGDSRDWEMDYWFGVVVYIAQDPNMINVAEKQMDTVLDTLDAAFAANLTLSGAVIVIEPANTQKFEIQGKSKLLYTTMLWLKCRILQPTNAF